jgi:hypothetical protein
MPPEPGSGRTISPIAAAALCIRPRPLLTERQRAKVDVLKAALPDFARMRSLAMRFCGLLRGGPQREARPMAVRHGDLRHIQRALRQNDPARRRPGSDGRVLE